MTNMPGAVPRTSSLALANATLPYALNLACKGRRRSALRADPALLKGLNTAAGRCAHPCCRRNLQPGISFSLSAR